MKIHHTPAPPHVQALRTENGWYLCQQLNELQDVCEFLHHRSHLRYDRDFYPPELELPFLIKDLPTEDRSIRMLQVVKFYEAHQVICFASEPPQKRNFPWRHQPKRPPEWVWKRPPFPFIDSSGYRNIAISHSGFHCAREQDRTEIDTYFKLLFRDTRLVYPDEYDSAPIPHLVKVTHVAAKEYVLVTIVQMPELNMLFNCWALHYGVQHLEQEKRKAVNGRMCHMIDSLITVT